MVRDIDFQLLCMLNNKDVHSPSVLYQQIASSTPCVPVFQIVLLPAVSSKLKAVCFNCTYICTVKIYLILHHCNIG